MPVIGGRFYANPAFGEALERAREQEAARSAGREPGRVGESLENKRVTRSAAARTEEKPPTPQQVIDQVRNSEEYRRLGKDQRNERAQKLFDALAQHYGNMGAIYDMARFAEAPDSGEDFEGFHVGTKPGRNAARHFFWSAAITAETNSGVAAALGYAKEGYDLVGGDMLRKLTGRDVHLPGAGHPAAQDLAANAAGRRLARELHERQHNMPFPQVEKSPVKLSSYTQF